MEEYSAAGRAMSYAAAIQIIPQDWHIEFPLKPAKLHCNERLQSSMFFEYACWAKKDGRSHTTFWQGLCKAVSTATKIKFLALYLLFNLGLTTEQ